MNVRAIAAVIVIFAWGAGTRPVDAVGGSAISSVPMLSAVADDRGIRERVPLTTAGDLLVGRPRHSSVALISVYAPGVRGSTAILRQFRDDKGRESLLLSLPPGVADKVRRVALFVHSRSGDLTILEEVNGEWLARRPQSLDVSTEAAPGTGTHLVAFNLRATGLYFLVDGRSDRTEVTGARSRSPATVLGGGSMLRAASPWLFSVVLLCAGSLVSWWVHLGQRTRNR